MKPLNQIRSLCSKRRLCFLLMLSFMFSSLVLKPVHAAEPDAPGNPEPAKVGEIAGYVADAQTGEMLPGCTVVMAGEVGKGEIRRQTTEGAGFYILRAPLGYLRSSFAWNRVLGLSLASIFSGGGKNVDKNVTVTQVELTVTRDGYKPFHDVVPICDADLQEKEFRVWLSPVLLAPLGSPSASYYRTTAAARYLKTTSSVQWAASLANLPTTVKPGDQLTANGTLDTRFYTVKPGTKPVWFLYFIDWGLKPLVSPKMKFLSTKISNELALKETENAARYSFTLNYKLPEDLQPGLIRLNFRGCPNVIYIPVAPPADKMELIAPLIAQLNENPRRLDELAPQMEAVWPESAASLNGFLARFLMYANPQKAFASYQKCGVKDSDLEAHLLWGCGKTAESAALIKKEKSGFDAHKEVLEALDSIRKTPANYLARARVISSSAGVRNPEAQEMALRDIPAPSNANEKMEYGSLLIAQNKLDEAIQMYQSLISASENSGSGEGIGQQSVRLALASVLFKQKRFTEALPCYETAWTVAAQKNDFGNWDFFALHQYGVLLLSHGKADQGLSVLARAASRARDKKFSAPNSTSQYFGGNLYTVYTGAAVTYSVGYMYPQADADAVIVESWNSRQDPQTGWAEKAVLGSALVRAGLEKEGLALLQETAAKWPEEPGVILRLAEAYQTAGNHLLAMKTVRKALTLNPADPQAKLLEHDLELEAKKDNSPADD